VVEYDQFRAGGGGFGRQLLNLALTDQCGRLRGRPRLNSAADDRRASADREFLKFIEGFFRVERRRQGGAPPGPGTAGPFNADQNRAFVGGVRFRRAYASGES
jgi:hypothetical protein